MSYDVTFHCISESELNRYVFDILKKPELLNSRAQEITSDKNKQDMYIEIFQEFMIPWYINEEVPTGDKISVENFDKCFSYAIACVAGFLHPYWYARNTAVSFLDKQGLSSDSHFESFSALNNSPLAKFNANASKTITTNYSASGVVKNVSVLKDMLIENQNILEEALCPDGFESLFRSIDYCINNELYFFEASEVVTPLIDQCQSDIDNLKAHFLKNLDEQSIPRKSKEVESLNKNNSCVSCGQVIGFIDVFKAGLPTLISCGNCQKKVKFNINPYVDYPFFLFLFVLFVVSVFYVNDYLVSTQMIPIENKHITVGVIISFSLIFEVIFSAWILKVKKVIG